MKRYVLAVILSLALPFSVFAKQCDDHFSNNALQTLKKNNFIVKSPEKRNKTALGLLLCLGEADPKIRDEIVYEATSQWLRGELLEQITIKTMFDFLIQTLEQPNQDPLNFTQPFAALVLSEVIRVDRISPYLQPEERQKVINITTTYMANIDDYRGFDDNHGWRHSVAHTADIFLQLSLNKAVSKAQLNQLLDGITSQISAKESHFYIYGEPRRLAMPFIYIVLQGKHSEKEIVSFLESVANPAPYTNWQNVYKDNQALAKLHNTRSFVYSVLAISEQSQNPTLKAIKPKLIALIQSLG